MGQRLVIYCDVCRSDTDVSGIEHSVTTTVQRGTPVINGIRFNVTLRISSVKTPELCSKCCNSILHEAARKIIKGEE